MKSLTNQIDPPFAADGGVEAPSPPAADPYLALDDLMAAVEALCPVWPERECFVDGGKMLL